MHGDKQPDNIAVQFALKQSSWSRRTSHPPVNMQYVLGTTKSRRAVDYLNQLTRRPRRLLLP